MSQTTSSKWSIKTIALIGLMTAVICVISPFSIPIPISPVPITLSIFAIYLSLFALGMTKGFLSCVIYLCLGLAGVPVFAGFTCGAGKLLGPTGGYLLGYLFLALIAGFFIERFGNKCICLCSVCSSAPPYATHSVQHGLPYRCTSPSSKPCGRALSPTSPQIW